MSLFLFLFLFPFLSFFFPAILIYKFLCVCVFHVGNKIPVIENLGATEVGLSSGDLIIGFVCFWLFSY